MRLRRVNCEICVSTYRDLREIHKVRGDAGLLMELKTPTHSNVSKILYSALYPRDTSVAAAVAR